MATGTGTGVNDGRRPQWRVLYTGAGITITSWYVEVRGVRVPVKAVQDPTRCLGYEYPAAKVAIGAGIAEIVLAVPLAAAFGSWLVALAGLLSAAGMMLATWADARNNPRSMTIEATVGARRMILFDSCHEREFGQVWRALVRAIEDSRDPLP